MRVQSKKKKKKKEKKMMNNVKSTEVQNPRRFASLYNAHDIAHALIIINRRVQWKRTELLEGARVPSSS